MAQQEQVRCEACLGMGYKGYKDAYRRDHWRIGTCRACGGTGQREPNKRKPRSAVRP